LSAGSLTRMATGEFDREFGEILRRAVLREGITATEIERLLMAGGDEISELALAADCARRLDVGEIVTYVRNRNINFTNVCVGSCAFCGFRRDPDDPDAYVLSSTQIRSKVAEALRAGATEICLQGGLHPDFGLDDYLRILKTVRSVSETVHIHAFSPAEIDHICRQEGMDVHEVLLALRESGLDSVPGTAAEVLSDRVREIICPRKMKTLRWVEIFKACHSLGLPTSSTIMYGTVETPAERAEHMLLLREIQLETGGFTEFVLLPFVSPKTPLGKMGAKSPDLIDSLRMHAVARLVLGDVIKNIQTSWVKLGLEGARVMLMAGANDLGGTLMEENITRAAGRAVECASAEELERIALKAGRVPAERTTTYRLLKISNLCG